MTMPSGGLREGTKARKREGTKASPSSDFLVFSF
jgi:hypothetical protein